MKAKKGISKKSAPSKQFLIQLQEIKESDFFCKDIPVEQQEQIKEKEIRIGFGVKFESNQQNKTITLGFQVTYECDHQGEKCQLLKYEMFTTFLIHNFDEVCVKSESEETLIDDGLLITLLGVVIGTARGMIVAKTAGHFINKYYLPIINPQEMYKSMFVKRNKGLNPKTRVKK